MIEWVDIDGVCSYFGVSESTIIRWERSGFPYHKLGKIKRYNLAECNDWFIDKCEGRNACGVGGTL
jgi:hypothetical protein